MIRFPKPNPPFTDEPNLLSRISSPRPRPASSDLALPSALMSVFGSKLRDRAEARDGEIGEIGGGSGGQTDPDPVESDQADPLLLPLPLVAKSRSMPGDTSP